MREVLAAALAAAWLVLAACTPTLMALPEEPIVINLNVKIEHEIRFRDDKGLDDLIAKGDSAPGGLELAPLDEATRRRFRIPDGVLSGVVVVEVAAGSPAARAGLQAGDVISEVDGEPVRSVAEFRRRYVADGEASRLLVQRRASVVSDASSNRI